MPAIGAGMVAMLAGWMIDGVLQPYVGMGTTFMISFAVSAVVFYVAKKWLNDLRDR